jgi:hypothetical protein
VVAAEGFDEDQVIVAGVLDVVAAVAPDHCAAGEPLVGQAVRRCYAKQVDTVRRLLGDDEAVRRWFGAGMLDNVVAVLGLGDIDEPWAHVLTAR